MHEMTIAARILDIAAAEAAGAGAIAINRIEVDIGALAGVETEALEFCFRAARAGAAAAAELVIHHLPGRGVCPGCGAEVAVEFFVAICPACGHAGVDITQGRELAVRCINVD